MVSNINEQWAHTLLSSEAEVGQNLFMIIGVDVQHVFRVVVKSFHSTQDAASSHEVLMTLADTHTRTLLALLYSTTGQDS